MAVFFSLITDEVKSGSRVPTVEDSMKTLRASCNYLGYERKFTVVSIMAMPATIIVDWYIDNEGIKTMDFDGLKLLRLI